LILEFIIKKKIFGRRIVNNCHFCGEVGHIKQTCLKKQTFDKTTKIPLNLGISPSPFVTYDIEFIRTIIGLLQLNLGITIDKLIRIKTIVNTLIYFHPSQIEYCSNSTNFVNIN